MAAIDLVKAPPGATSAELRRLGLKSAALGLVFFLPGVFWFIIAHDWALETFGTRVGDTVYIPRSIALLIGGPMTAGYALLMIGVSRVLFGAASQSTSALASIARILFGLVFTVGMIAVAILVFASLSRS